MGDLYALDFDGVLCDSCGESSLSAVKVNFTLLTLPFAFEILLCFSDSDFEILEFCDISCPVLLEHLLIVLYL